MESQFYRRLNSLRRRTPSGDWESDRQFAARLGIDPGMLRAYRRGTVAPQAATISAIARKAGVPESIEVDLQMAADNLRTVLSEPHRRRKLVIPPAVHVVLRDREESPQLAVVTSEQGGNFVNVPRISTMLAAGAGAEPTLEEMLGEYKFRRDWISSITSDPGALRLVEVRGDSMSPTLESGDMILVDTSRTAARHRAIFAFRCDGVLRIKRLIMTEDATEIVSDNKDYPSKKVAHNEMAILGQVIWCARQLL